MSLTFLHRMRRSVRGVAGLAAAASLGLGAVPIAGCEFRSPGTASGDAISDVVVSGDQVVRIERLPKPVRRIYPRGMGPGASADAPHTLIVQVEVGPRGSVESARIVRGLTNELDRAALRAAFAWRFRPALGPDGPVSCRVAIPMRLTRPD